MWCSKVWVQTGGEAIPAAAVGQQPLVLSGCGRVQGIHCSALFAASVFCGCCNYAGAEEVGLVT